MDERPRFVRLVSSRATRTALASFALAGALAAQAGEGIVTVGHAASGTSGTYTVTSGRSTRAARSMSSVVL